MQKKIKLNLKNDDDYDEVGDREHIETEQEKKLNYPIRFELESR